MKNIKTGAYFLGEESYNFNFATDITAYRKMMFVNYVVDSIIDGDRYDSIVKDIVFDFAIISIMTDIDTSFIHQKDEEGNVINPIIFIEQFLEETNVVDIVKANMVDGLLEELNNAVDKSIAYRTGIHPNPLNEAIANLVNTFGKKVKDVDLDSMIGLLSQFSEMSGEFTPENVVNAYMNSDAHKKNVEEAAKEKKKTKKAVKVVDKAVKSGEQL